MAKYEDVITLKDNVSKTLVKIHKNFLTLDKKMQSSVKQLQKFNTRLQNVTTLSRMSCNGLKKLTSAFVGLVGASGIVVAGINKVTEFGDNIDKMSQKIGMNIEKYQEWDYIMSQNGGNVESLQMGYKTLATQMNNVKKGSKESIKAFKQLGVRVTDNKGAFRGLEDVFDDVIKALQNEKNETKKAIIGNQLFGRSFVELKPLLNQSAESVEALREKAHKLGLIMSKEDVKASVDFKDTMDTLTRFLQANFNKAIVQLLPRLQEFANMLMKHKDIIIKLTVNLGNLAIKILEIFEFMGEHKALLSGILATVVALAAPVLFANIVSGFMAVAGALATVGITANIWFAGIPLLIGAIVAGIVALIGWIKKLKGVAGDIDVGSSFSKDLEAKIGERRGWGGHINENNSINGSYNNTTTNNYYNVLSPTNKYLSPNRTALNY